MATQGALVYYINGHGFGHATRTIAVLNEVWRLAPAQRVLIRTDAPAFLFRRGCTGPYRLLAGDVDPGTVQADPLRLDREASIAARARAQADVARAAEREARRLASEGVRLVAGDIPPLAFEVAARLRVPSVAVGNFSWDWIYEPYVRDRPEHADLVPAIRRSYGHADLLLRLPLHGPMDAFRRVEEIPHVVRPARRDRGATRAALGLPGERRPLVVVTFGGFGGMRLGDACTADPGPYRFVTFADAAPGMPEDTLRLPMDHGHGHEDLIAAADAVITKPGYGTVVECLASRTPFLYTSRDDFREYDVIVGALRGSARARFLPREDLQSLRWRPHLEALLADRTPWADVPTGGARVAAARLLEIAGGRRAGP